MSTRPRSRNPANSRDRPGHERRGEPSPAAPASQLDELVLHDLLNPMTGVIGQLEMLEDQLETKLSAQDRQRLDQCLESARDLSDMLVNLRHLCHLQSAPEPMEPTSIPLHALLQSVKHEQDWPPDAAVHVAEVSDSQTGVRDDSQLLARAMGLLGQAALRLSDASRIEFAGEPVHPDRVRLTCRWAGSPLPEPVRRTLFTADLASVQREYGLRVDRARGIELVHCIAQHLEGTVDYEQESDGGVFVVIVPRADPAEAGAGAARTL